MSYLGPTYQWLKNIYLLSLKSLVSSTALWHLLMVNLTIWAEIIVSLQLWETVYENLCGLQDRNYSIKIFSSPKPVVTELDIEWLAAVAVQELGVHPQAHPLVVDLQG